MSDERKSNKAIKVTIIVLSVLLFISVFALVGNIIYKHASGSNKDTDEVPNNSITPKDGIVTQSVGRAGSIMLLSGDFDDSGRVSISLNNKNAEYNTAFEMKNMFPGDTETKIYCLDVSYKNEVTVNLSSKIPVDGILLSGVLDAKLIVRESGDVLYEGKLINMPSKITHKLTHDGIATDTVTMEMTISMDTSAGNEYQGLTSRLDLEWSVSDESSLTPEVPTGSEKPTEGEENTGNVKPTTPTEPTTPENPSSGCNTSNALIIAGVVLSVGVCAFIIFIIIKRRRDKEDE